MKPIFRPAIAGLGLIAATSPITFAQEPVDPTKAEIAELRQQVLELTKTVRDLQQQVAARPAEAPAESSAPAIPPAPADSKAVINTPQTVSQPDLAVDLSANPLPEPKRTDLSIFNPEISAAIDAIGSYSTSANNANLTVRDIELMVQSNVDQLAHAYVVFNAESELDPWAKTDPFSEVSVGVEEAAIETTVLPYGLALKGGQFFADFTRLGKVHSHELPFTDRPASLDGILGGETKSRGVELSWVPPSGHYFRFTAGAVDNIGAETAANGVFTTLDGEGEDLFASRDNRSFGDIMFYGRAATIFELGDSTSLNLGLDYARGSDTGTRELASGDFKLTWLPDAASFDRLEVGGEYLHGKTDGTFSPAALFAGGPTGGSCSADGAYIYAQYRIGKEWEPGIRYDWFRPESWAQTDGDGDDIADGLARSSYTQNTLSAYLTYNLSEFNRLRLGVSHINGETGAFSGEDNDWLGFMQWSIIIGPHKHSFQP
jgi:hypothetical protein